jgi:hypothetical protein
MKTTFYADTDASAPNDAITPDEPWGLGKGDLILPAKRPPNRRRTWVLIAGVLLGAGGVAALLLGLLRLDRDAPEKKDDPPPAAKRTEIRKNLYFELQGDTRRVIVVANVVLRDGPLEGLMCRKNTKEHEYILATDVDARDIHAALLAANAKPGTPVQFAPKYVPASGSVIKVTLQYQKDGKQVTVRGQDWIRDVKTGKPMEQDWVFGGSRFIMDPDDVKNPIYLANQGDVICVCNMETAMLDLPIRSPKSPENRIYNALTSSIPPKDTKVDVILEAVPAKP